MTQLRISFKSLRPKPVFLYIIYQIEGQFCCWWLPQNIPILYVCSKTILWIGFGTKLDLWFLIWENLTVQINYFGACVSLKLVSLSLPKTNCTSAEICPSISRLHTCVPAKAICAAAHLLSQGQSLTLPPPSIVKCHIFWGPLILSKDTQAFPNCPIFAGERQSEQQQLETNRL